jgi:dynein heavy chain
MYQALLHATKKSLNLMKDRVCGKKPTKGEVVTKEQKPFFELDLILNLDENNTEDEKIQMSPNLGDIQVAINKAATAVLRCSKTLYNWGQAVELEDQRESF